VSRPAIAVVGSSNIDFIMKMERLPRAGETITDAVFLQTFGGKGANQAVAAARAGGDVWFVNCVGDDALTPRMLEALGRDGIHTEFVFRENGCSSGTALVMIGEQGANYLSVAPGANYLLDPGRIDRAARLFRRDMVFLFQYEIPAATLSYAIAKAKAAEARVILNFAPARAFSAECFRQVDVLVVNELEAKFLSGVQISGKDDAANAASALLALGAAAVVITLGSQGAYAAAGALRRHIPPFPVAVVDTTAAGDTFCGALAVALAEGLSQEHALRFASAAAALSVTRMGAQPSIPLRAEIEEFLRARGPVE